MGRLKNTEKLRSFNLPEFIQRIKDAYEEYPEDKLEGLVRIKTLIASCLESKTRAETTSNFHILVRSRNELV